MKTRRTFIKEFGGIAAVTCCGAGMVTLLEGCTSVKSIQGSWENKRLKVSLAEMGDDKFAIIRFDKLPAPIFLSKNNEKSRAFLMLCTHNECELKATGTYLYCPCHGSEFSSTGKVLKPPAEDNLKEYPVTADNTTIYIELN